MRQTRKGGSMRQTRKEGAMRQTGRSAGVLAWVVVALGVVVLGVPFVSAQTDVLYVVNNNVGIGTASPAGKLSIQQGTLQLTGTSQVPPTSGKGIEFFFTGVNGNMIAYDRTGGAYLPFGLAGSTVGFSTSGANRVFIDAAGHFGIGTTSPAYPLQMGSGAYCSVGGVWTNASSREYKQDIQELSTEAAEATLEKLNPVTYAYKAAPGEHHVGFIAEDAPDLVATADRKGMSALDVVAVLTKVVQEQQKTIAELKAEVAELKQQK